MEHLENKLKEWIAIDEKIYSKNNEIKELKLIKNELNDELFEIIETNTLQKSTFKINNNFIKYNTVKQTAPITLKYLESCLSDLIDDRDQIENIMNYIKSNRQTKIVTELKNNKK